MANQRKKGKKKVAFWLTTAERDLLKQLADEQGINMTDVIRTILINHSKKKGILK